MQDSFQLSAPYGPYDSRVISPWALKIFVNPLPDDKILDWFKLKQIADDILKYI